MAASWRKLLATMMPLTDSWICALISAVTRRACCVMRRAIRRKLSAISAAIGVSASSSNVSGTLMRNRTKVRIITSRIWLSKLVVSVTTSERSWVSEVTRLTILPEGNSSKKDMS